jgi:hypothetical protein
MTVTTHKQAHDAACLYANARREAARYVRKQNNYTPLSHADEQTIWLSHYEAYKDALTGRHGASYHPLQPLP